MNMVSLEQNLGLKLFIQILLHIYVKEVKSYHSEFKNQFIVITDNKIYKTFKSWNLEPRSLVLFRCLILFVSELIKMDRNESLQSIWSESHYCFHIVPYLFFMRCSSSTQLNSKTNYDSSS